MSSAIRVRSQVLLLVSLFLSHDGIADAGYGEQDGEDHGITNEVTPLCWDRFFLRSGHYDGQCCKDQHDCADHEKIPK